MSPSARRWDTTPTPYSSHYSASATRKKAEEAHATSAQKPFTVSPLIARGTRHRDSLHLQAGTDCKLRFTFLSDALFAHFALVFFTHPLPSIRLGHATLQINRLTTTPDETDHWGSMTTYEELIETAETATHMQMRFHSPTAFRALTPRGQDRRDEPAIDLVRCYQSWINKWNTFAPAQIDKEKLLEFVAEPRRADSNRFQEQSPGFREK